MSTASPHFALQSFISQQLSDFIRDLGGRAAIGVDRHIRLPVERPPLRQQRADRLPGIIAGEQGALDDPLADVALINGLGSNS